jgi:hypothetical protein
VEEVKNKPNWFVNLFYSVIGWNAAVRNVEGIGVRIKGKGIVEKAKYQIVAALCGQFTAIFIVLTEVKSLIDYFIPLTGLNIDLATRMAIFSISVLAICISLYRLSLVAVSRVYDLSNEYSLLHEPLFTFPLILAYNIIVYFIYEVSKSYGFLLTIEGLKLFVEVYQPLAQVLGVIGVFMTFVALVNRSELTSKQIVIANNQYKESQNQNTFTNYFKHLEEFEKYAESKTTMFANVRDTRQLHGNLYGTFTDFHFEISKSLISELKEKLKELNSLSAVIYSEPNKIEQQVILNVIDITDWIEKEFHIQPFNDYEFTIFIVPVEGQPKEYYFPIRHCDLRNLIIHRLVIVESIYRFSNKEKLGDDLDSLLNINLYLSEEKPFTYQFLTLKDRDKLETTEG